MLLMTFRSRPSDAVARVLSIAAATVAALALAACGKEGSKPATQVAAKVNKEEISVHQINFVLQRQQGLKPEQAEVTGQQVLERLIDQEVAVQKAQEQKIDRDPAVMQEIEAARREIIARAYVGKVGNGVSKPTPEEVKAYYDSKPALFRNRRIYSMVEMKVQASPQQVADMQSRLSSFKSMAELGDYLKQSNLRVSTSQNTTPAENLPLQLIDRFAALKEGETVFAASPGGARLLTVTRATDAPVTEEQGRPAIEQYLINERRRKAIEEDMKMIRSTAHVEYIGRFAPAASGATANPAATPAAAASAAAALAATPAPKAPASAAGLDDASLNKGLAGLK